MRRATIIYAPADSAVAALAAEMEHAFDPNQFRVRMKEAAQAAVPDLAAADVILLGSQPDGRAAVHRGFNEIIRSLRGINLAGRVAGLFAVGSRKTLEVLRRALKDSDVLIAAEEFVLEPGAGDRHGEKAGAWVRSIVELLEQKIQ